VVIKDDIMDVLDNLRKRGIILVGWCFMCKHSGKSVNHLFLHCEVVRALWSVVFSLFDVTWVMPGGVVELLACWCSKRGNILAKKVWQIAPMEELKKLFIQILLHWADTFSVPWFSTISQFLTLCSSFCL
jgi:hypothetical protein